MPTMVQPAAGGGTAAGNVLDIAGNVDPASGHVDHAGDVAIAGNVADLMRVRAGGTVRVGGVVQEATVQAGGSLVAAGGIACRNKGRCMAAGDVAAKYVLSSVVEAGGNVTVEAEVRASRITCGGRLVVAAGQILGGDVAAAGGVTCKTLGGPTGVETTVTAGAGAALADVALRAACELDTYRDKARRAAAIGNRLLKDQKRLSPHERERATELLFKSYELEQLIKDTVATIRAKYDEAVRTANPEVRVAEALFPGVVLRFPGLEASVETALRGPVRIAPKGTGARGTVIAIDESGRAMPLPTRRADDDVLGEVLRMGN